MPPRKGKKQDEESEYSVIWLTDHGEWRLPLEDGKTARRLDVMHKAEKPDTGLISSSVVGAIAAMSPESPRHVKEQVAALSFQFLRLS